MHGSRTASDQHEPADLSRLPPTRQLALCVDDFGLHPGVQQAVARLAALGRVQAVSVMVGAPALARGGPLLRELDPALAETGLHLDFIEHPLLPASRRSLPAWLTGPFGRPPARQQMRAEIAAQLDAFEAATGRAPSFVDGHRHVHQVAGLRDTLLDELRQRYRGRLPWLRSTRPPPGAGAKARLLHRLGGRRLDRLAQAQGFAQNRQLLGVYDFQPVPARYRSLLRGWLAAAGDGDLLMAHPSSDAPAFDAIGAARLMEYRLLESPDFVSLCQAAGVHLAPLGPLLRHAAAAPG